MAAMTKIVNIRTRVAVKTVTPPICGTVKGIVMTTGDILKCLCKRAQVEEVLPDGRTVKLNMSNYYMDNGAGLDAKKNLPAPEKKLVEKIERFKVPVAPADEAEKQVVETKTEENDDTTVIDMTTNNNVTKAETETVETAFVTGMSIEGDTPTDDTVNTTTETVANTVEAQNTSKTSSNNKKKKNK